MPQKTTNVYPDIIRVNTFKNDEYISIHAYLHADTTLKADEILSINIDIDAARKLHDSLGYMLKNKTSK